MSRWEVRNISTEDDYGKAVKEFYRIYRQLQEEHDLMEQSHFDINGNNCIEILEYESGKEKTCIVKITGDNPEDCYRRAAAELQKYKNIKEKEDAGHEGTDRGLAC
ncbi:MAG: hypothetical protein NC337_09310 [Roseburia sp.]|nr:hypothetical protein [Roseburia sp.]